MPKIISPDVEVSACELGFQLAADHPSFTFICVAQSVIEGLAKPRVSSGEENNRGLFFLFYPYSMGP